MTKGRDPHVNEMTVKIDRSSVLLLTMTTWVAKFLATLDVRVPLIILTWVVARGTTIEEAPEEAPTISEEELLMKLARATGTCRTTRKIAIPTLLNTSRV